jgi:hypothetical protein
MQYLPEDARGNVAEYAEVQNHYAVWVAGIEVHATDKRDEAMAIVAMLDKYPATRAALVDEAYAYQAGRYQECATWALGNAQASHEHIYDDATGEPYICPVQGCWFGRNPGAR